MPRGPKGEKRPVIDAPKTAYHGYQLAELLGELRHGWGRIKGGSCKEAENIRGPV
jgi:hypothetical protein